MQKMFDLRVGTAHSFRQEYISTLDGQDRCVFAEIVVIELCGKRDGESYSLFIPMIEPVPLMSADTTEYSSIITLRLFDTANDSKLEIVSVGGKGHICESLQCTNLSVVGKPMEDMTVSSIKFYSMSQ